ncbi:MAG: hypothetical protein WD696_05185 [Bryobacteraceae bacterium]
MDKNIQQVTGILLLAALAQEFPLLAATRGREVLYVGGTIAGLPELTKGALDTTSDANLVFSSPKGSFTVAYESIQSLEYGQKVGRRLGVAVVLTTWALLSKKRKHYLTLGYEDADGKPHGVVFEIPKGKAKAMITIIEVRSGRKVEYESEEARRHVHG